MNNRFTKHLSLATNLRFSKQLIPVQTLRTFSNQPGRPMPGESFPGISAAQQRQEIRKSQLDETMRDKMKTPLGDDTQDDTSYMDNYLILKFLGLGLGTIYAAYKGNSYLQEMLAERQARNNGTLDEYLEKKEKAKEKSLQSKVLGHRPTADITIGADWELKDCRGKPFSSYEHLNGHYYLLFFGSTLCPDVCPLTLMRMLKAKRIVSRSSEGRQFVRFVPIFVVTKPEYDTVPQIEKFSKVFDHDLVILREDSSKSPNHMAMLKAFRVPVNCETEAEAEEMRQFFRKKQGWFESLLSRWSGNNALDDDAYSQLHSKAIYLMGPDNKFIAFYQLELNEQELAGQIMEDISYDIGNRYIGSGGRPHDLKAE